MPADERAPRVVALPGIIERWRETIQQQDEEIGRLKAEMARLKGAKARPNLKPSRMEPAAGRESASAPAGEAAPQRPGSAKRRKTRAIPIHRAINCPPPALPEGSQCWGDEPYVVQERVRAACNTRFLVECGQTPAGECRRGELPAWGDGPFISDDAGPFAVPWLRHGLCWVPAERTLHPLHPGGPLQPAAVERVRGEIWTLHRDLKADGLQPDDTRRGEPAARSDPVFRQKTG